MPHIIQFTHPGQEHGPDRKEKTFKSWNQGNHKRKFLQARGKYFENGEVGSDILRFWGEWEPPSKVQMLEKHGDRFPKYLHHPILPKEIPQPSESQKYQNTDPYVFDSHFRYFICKQFNKKGLTQLSRLDPGSIIVFGSTKGKKRDASLFQADTILVVKESTKYNTQMDSFPFDDKNNIYQQLTIGMTHIGMEDYDLDLRVYFGSNPLDRFNDMYSFVPAKKSHSENIGFPRFEIKDMPFITNNLNAAPKISKVTDYQSKDFFDELVYRSRDQGFIEGFDFEYNQE